MIEYYKLEWSYGYLSRRAGKGLIDLREGEVLAVCVGGPLSIDDYVRCLRLATGEVGRTSYENIENYCKKIDI